MNFIFTAKIIGIVLIVLYTIGGLCLMIEDPFGLTPWYGTLLVTICINLINALLYFGAKRKNQVCVMTWIVLTILILVSLVYQCISGYLASETYEYANYSASGVLFCIILYIPAIFIAWKSKKQMVFEESRKADAQIAAQQAAVEKGLTMRY